MKLPVLASKTSLKGKRVFLRVDWNVPVSGEFAAEESLKLHRSIATVRMLASRGAVVLIATHLGRPKGRDPKLSTRNLAVIVGIHHGLKVDFVGDAIDTPSGLSSAAEKIAQARPGDIFLLENVRYYAGEERNDIRLAKAFASLADVFVNDAFASCHRVHASVVGVAKLLPRYAGPTLLDEVTALEKLITKPKKPFVAIIGGAKLTTKLPVLEALLKTADIVMLGGAMATAFFAAQKKQIGKSFVEKEGIPFAKKLLKHPRLRLPVDVVVATTITDGARAHAVSVDSIKKNESIGDIGPVTMRAWAAEIKKAKTIVWNGPVGVAEKRTFSHGSMVIARAIAARSRGPTYGVVGGGDTLPIALATGMSEWYDHLSTGGGAMLEFIVLKGKLPGLTALASNVPSARARKKKRV